MYCQDRWKDHRHSKRRSESHLLMRRTWLRKGHSVRPDQGEIWYFPPFSWGITSPRGWARRRSWTRDQKNPNGRSPGGIRSSGQVAKETNRRQIWLAHRGRLPTQLRKHRYVEQTDDQMLWCPIHAVFRMFWARNGESRISSRSQFWSRGWQPRNHKKTREYFRTNHQSARPVVLEPREARNHQFWTTKGQGLRTRGETLRGALLTLQKMIYSY